MRTSIFLAAVIIATPALAFDNFLQSVFDADGPAIRRGVPIGDTSTPNEVRTASGTLDYVDEDPDTWNEGEPEPEWAEELLGTPVEVTCEYDFCEIDPDGSVHSVEDSYYPRGTVMIWMKPN